MASSVRAKKSLGQHFLIDDSYCRRIVGFSQIDREDLVFEIGPGTGQLTAVLLERAARVVAIEFDRDMIAFLQDRFPEQDAACSRLHLLHADALKLDWAGVFDRFSGSSPASPTKKPARETKIVGNLPYNIATRLLTMTSPHQRRFQSFTFMVQQEVAARILASPGTKDYGYLTLLLEYHFERVRGFDVPPGAFRPRPRVNSHVMQLISRADLEPAGSYPLFVRLIQQAFQQRRKTLWNNLEGLGYAAEVLSQAFHQAGIDRSVRAEQVPLAGYTCLSRMLCLQV